MNCMAKQPLLELNAASRAPEMNLTRRFVGSLATAYPLICPYKDDKTCDTYNKEREKCVQHAGVYTVGAIGGGIVPHRNNQVRFCDCCTVTAGYSTDSY